MRALVTGANGFVGIHLVKHLRSCGDEVLESAVDITDRDRFRAHVVDAAPDVVYHLAAQADVGGSWEHPIPTLRVNVEGTVNVLDAAVAAGVRRVLAVTSADIYGPVTASDLPLTESQPVRPVSPYGASKAAADIMCVTAGVAHGLEVVRARAFNHLGPGQNDKFVASAIASRIVSNERSGDTTVRVGNLDARRDFTDVRDVARAYRLLVTAGDAGEVYHICSGVDRPVRELADRLIALAEHEMTLEVDEDLYRPVDLPVLRGDHTKITEATGWEPQVDLATTLHDLLDYWRTHPEGVTSPEIV
ncbi:MAG: GDP-mannose 4,6-dehydratase [Acidimicrobiales bacterium]|nr:MAG: GDP-mannose 4,6-dehydratase [Acidimicrobiales bacterium]